MSKGGSCGETCCGAKNGMRGNQSSGARFPQRERQKESKQREETGLSRLPRQGPFAVRTQL